jgi:hypothetical protein
MSSCKTFVILLLILAVSVGQRNNYKPCNPLPDDNLLRSVTFARSSRFLKQVSATLNVNVKNDIISCVHALDQSNDGNGGSVKIVGGGIGFNYVDVKITSKFNRGFWFVIDVYGKPRTCKYLRSDVLIFGPAHTNIITADTLRFTPKSFRLNSL